MPYKSKVGILRRTNHTLDVYSMRSHISLILILIYMGILIYKYYEYIYIYIYIYILPGLCVASAIKAGWLGQHGHRKLNCQRQRLID